MDNNKNKNKNEKSKKNKLTKKKMDKLIEEYVSTFDEKDREAYEIAKEHLQSSFSLVKSIGFNKFLTGLECQKD